MKRILIDGRFIGVGESMTRYCLELVQGILALDKENEYTLLVRPQAKSQISNLKSQNFGNLNYKILDIPHYSLLEQTALLKYLNAEKFDLVHFIQFNHPVRYKGKFVVTIHDLTLFGHLHRKDILKRAGFSAVMRSAVKNSAKIITISNTTKQDIVENYKVEPDKVTVTYLAVDEKYCLQVKSRNREIEKFKQKYGIAGDYLLYTGMWKKHKNLLRMLKAFEKFINDQFSISNSNEFKNGAIEQFNNNFPQLVLVGKIDKDEQETVREIERVNQNVSTQKDTAQNTAKDNNSTIQQFNNNKSNDFVSIKPIVCTGFVDEAELPLAYAGALAYVIPSLSEGFGLPPLEAMACGTPVLSSNVSAMPEILGDAPLYFDPYDVADMAEKMRLVVSDGQLRISLAAKGLEQVKKYSWKNTATQTLNIYKACLK